MPDISVIIPCHNDGKYLGEALESVLDQTFPPSDIVVIDDGSSDDSASVAASFGDRVRLIAQDRMGVSAARNAGIAASKGELIAFLDADDLWPRHSLQIRVERLTSVVGLDCVFGLVEQFLSPDLAPADAGRFWYDAGQKAARHVGAMLVRRAMIDRIGGFNTDLKIGEIMDFVARMADDGAPTSTVDMLVMRRRIHGNNTMIQNRGSHADYLRVLKANLNRRAAAPAAGVA